MKHSLSPEQPPAHAIYDAYLDAKRDIAPSFTTEALIGRLGLGGDLPDCRSFMDRLIDDSRSVNVFRKAIAVNRASDRLLDLTNQRLANPAQEALAHALGAAISRHLEREQQACPQVLHLAVTSRRPDIITPEAYQVARYIKLDQMAELITPPGEPPLMPEDLLAMEEDQLRELYDAVPKPNACQRAFC